MRSALFMLACTMAMILAVPPASACHDPPDSPGVPENECAYDPPFGVLPYASCQSEYMGDRISDQAGFLGDAAVWGVQTTFEVLNGC